MIVDFSKISGEFLRSLHSFDFWKETNVLVVKFIYSEKTTKILRNLPLTFDDSTYSQKLMEDFAKFCGLLRIYEL